MVDEHGGRLTFETAPGAGTTFYIRLPIAGRATAAAPPAEPPAALARAFAPAA